MLALSWATRHSALATELNARLVETTREASRSCRGGGGVKSAIRVGLGLGLTVPLQCGWGWGCLEVRCGERFIPPVYRFPGEGTFAIRVRVRVRDLCN